MLYGKLPPSSAVTPDPPIGTSCAAGAGAAIAGDGAGAVTCAGRAGSSRPLRVDFPYGENGTVFSFGLGFGFASCAFGGAMGAGWTAGAAGVIGAMAAGFAKWIIITEVACCDAACHADQ